MKKEETFEEWDRKRIKENRIVIIVSALITLVIVGDMLLNGGLFI